MDENRPLLPSRSLALPAELDPRRVVAFNVGPREDVWLVEALATPGAPDTRPDRRPFPDAPRRYRVWTLPGNGSGPARSLSIDGEPFGIEDVQPLGEDVLLVCRCSHFRGGDPDRNGRIYRPDGRLRRKLLLGDGIEGVQATAQGDIWVSYTDEGVLGQHGWREPLGASGLVAWGADGVQRHAFRPASGLGLPAIVHCYAMNAASDRDVWCCYYTGFPLVRLRDGKVASHWRMPLDGVRAFAIDGDRMLAAGAKGSKGLFVLLQLRDQGIAVRRGELRPCDTQGRRIGARRVIGRGGCLYALSDDSVYVFTVPASAPSRATR